MISTIGPHLITPCKSVGKSAFMIVVQQVTAVCGTRSYTERYASAGEADADKDAVAEEMAPGLLTVTPSLRAVTTETMVSTRTGIHTEETALEPR